MLLHQLRPLIVTDMSHTLYYIHDPMCSWCYAFGPVWVQLQATLPASVKIQRLLGGLAPDNYTPMDEAMRQQIESTWRRITKSVPGTTFNFDFWQNCTPYRSTYPSCRAVIAATAQGCQYNEAMTRAIQHAYYQQARNPSRLDTLIEIAKETGLDGETFSRAMSSLETEEELQRQITLARKIGADSYPALVLSVNGSYWPVAIDYRDPAPILDTIEFLLEA
jgi:putative protein-disulfide isomerase